MGLEEKRISRQNIFSGVVFDVFKDTVDLPNGNKGMREVVKHHGGVAVLAFTDPENIVMVRQFRYGVGETILELPAGKLEKGEDPRECGIRELKEETGYTAGDFEFLTEMFPTPAYCSEKIYIYTAKNLTPGNQDLDTNEFLELTTMPFEKVVEMCINGEISDGKTIIGVLSYYAAQKG